MNYVNYAHTRTRTRTHTHQIYTHIDILHLLYMSYVVLKHILFVVVFILCFTCSCAFVEVLV